MNAEEEIAELRRRIERLETRQIDLNHALSLSLMVALKASSMGLTGDQSRRHALREEVNELVNEITKVVDAEALPEWSKLRREP
ncbi:hypothetical protein [Palleronia sp.]|uniref:hypothetical protein n=1 Tax=Palleronia sp. TaxID=1940284 RepID=UPI0035C7C26E